MPYLNSVAFFSSLVFFPIKKRKLILLSMEIANFTTEFFN